MSTAEAALHAGQGRAPIVVESCQVCWMLETNGIHGLPCSVCDEPFPGRSDDELATGESERPNPQ